MVVALPAGASGAVSGSYALATEEKKSGRKAVNFEPGEWSGLLRPHSLS
jgi:hypothetical protein